MEGWDLCPLQNVNLSFVRSSNQFMMAMVAQKMGHELSKRGATVPSAYAAWLVQLYKVAMYLLVNASSVFQNLPYGSIAKAF